MDRPAAPPAAGALLAALVRLAAGEPEPDALLPAVLERMRAARAVGGCAVWTVGADGAVVPRWSAGEGAAGPDGAAVARAAAIGAPLPAGVDGHPLRVGDRLVGVLTVAAPPAPASAAGADDALAPVLDLLGVLVHDAARADALSAELARRAAADEAERRFVECVVDALPVGLYVVDREYRVRLWNHKREVGTHGLSRDEAIGRSVFDVLHRQDAALLRREFDEAFATGRLQRLDVESLASGEPRTYRLTKIPMGTGRGADRAPTHVITIGEDVTEWKGALERTAQAEKLAAIGQLAAGVMHEINNPLATIAACAETMTLALDDLPPGSVAPPGFGEYLRIVDHEVHRCRRIIDGLLNFSRARPVQRVVVGANAVVEQTLFLLKHHGRFKRCPLRLDLADGPGPAVSCDPDQLTQVLMALLLNAADAVAAATPAGDDEGEPPGITIRTRAADDGAVVEIADEGIGMPREALRRVFDPFFTTKAPGEGTGLGLAIAYGIVRDHGGRLEVDSEEGAGSTFRVVLPAADAGAAPAADPA